MNTTTQINWTKVKKSPVPKTADVAVIGYYRGDGIIITVEEGRMVVETKGGDLLGERLGDYAGYDTSEVKDMAKAMINRADMQAAEEDEPFTGYTAQMEEALKESAAPLTNDERVQLDKSRAAMPKMMQLTRQLTPTSNMLGNILSGQLTKFK